jgi:hypothetical protein
LAPSRRIISITTWMSATRPAPPNIAGAKRLMSTIIEPGYQISFAEESGLLPVNAKT